MSSKHTKKTAVLAVLFVIVALLAHPVLASNLDYVWGRIPSSIRIVGVENLGQTDSLRAGDWFQITYEIKVTKRPWESEDAVRQRVIEHFESIVGRTVREHPEIRIYYAEYRCYMVTGHFTREYYYRAKIIGHVEPIRLSNGTRLVSPVQVAVIIALILAAIIATIVLVKQPAVQKLLISTGEAIHAVASSTPLTLAFTLLSALMLATVMTAILGRRRA